MRDYELKRAIKEKKEELEELEKRLDIQKVLVCLMFEQFLEYLDKKEVFKDIKIDRKGKEDFAKNQLDIFLSNIEDIDINQGAILLNSFDYIYMIQGKDIRSSIFKIQMWRL